MNGTLVMSIKFLPLEMSYKYKVIFPQVNENHLNVGDLPCYIDLFDTIYSVEQDEQILPHLNQSIPGSLSLCCAFENCFTRNRIAFIFIGCYASAVIKPSSTFWFFDSYARN